MIKIEKEIGAKTLTLESGRIARRSDGAVLVQYGETIVLVTAVISSTTREEIDFVPLVVDYRERAYAAGKIPGGFFKREGRPSDGEILASRLIDRSIRPLLPRELRNEVQIIATVMSASESSQPPTLAIIGASSALAISGFPHTEAIGAVRVGMLRGEFVINPTDSELKESKLDIVVTGNKEGIIMVEGEAAKVEEEVVVKAFQEAHSHIKEIIQMEEEFISQVEKKKKDFPLPEIEEKLRKEIEEYAKDKIESIGADWTKEKKDGYLEKIREEVLTKFQSIYPDMEGDFLLILEDLKKKKMRQLIAQEGKRWDTRRLDEIRSINCEVGILPRVHGSGLFTRGRTQSLTVATLGTSADEQRINGLQSEEISKRFMLHYNFPPFSTGEARFMRGPGRREIGHGFLAERALLPVLPPEDSFPYTIRLVSDILESNGSSSMASVCAGSLCLMDAGVPISEPVAGVGIGLVKEGDRTFILTDIQGLEDRFGDMDFKVAGTRTGITALQLDVKISGLSLEILKEALERAKEGRNFILGEMEKTIKSPRDQLSRYAPHITILALPQDKIGDVIGPGGRVIKGIIKETGAEVDIDDMEGKVTVSSADDESTKKAVSMIKGIIEDPKVGKVYLGKVKRVTDFGAFVEILPGKEGLVHVSELSDRFVKNASDVVKVGDEISVRVLNIDELGRLNLSKKKAQPTGER
ncbi:polyribonucleotide nucleotidyltransferase [Candidatus Aerophobetes bacterium]|uniref:Polyribonucleotide nucleotidyltransferase n=1 Tax=Aerophobetes bacterium TaxID=2030807 RepID=A0A523W4Y9_UNCAE|nr:MAG: polyribonucleotide nucleotidyltransferase [Candidatus Aerophobetes bacterium]